MNRVGLILAAGRSTRFGTDNKLLADFHGRPLAEWAACAMRRVPLEHRLVVAGSPEVAALFKDFEVLRGPGDDAGQADSLKIGVARARTLNAERLLICLADMPMVRHGVLDEVLNTCRDDRASAAWDGNRRMPPACFPARDLPDLAALTGDTGAGSLLMALPEDALVRVSPERLVDVDTVQELEQLRHEPGTS